METHTLDQHASTMKRQKRSNLQLRIDLKLDGQKEVHCCSGNVSKGGAYIQLPEECQSKVLGHKGVCHIFVGHDFFEMPFDVVREKDHGVGIHVPKGYDDEFNRFLDRVQEGQDTTMGIDYAVGESIHPR